jgi:hypothetical protein
VRSHLAASKLSNKKKEDLLIAVFCCSGWLILDLDGHMPGQELLNVDLFYWTWAATCQARNS